MTKYRPRSAASVWLRLFDYAVKNDTYAEILGVLAQGIKTAAARIERAEKSTDKIMRLHAQTAMFENGHVLLPYHASWLADYVNELTGFPGTKYDDQVDSTTQALDYLRKGYSLDIWVRFADAWFGSRSAAL